MGHKSYSNVVVVGLETVCCGGELNDVPYRLVPSHVVHCTGTSPLNALSFSVIRVLVHCWILFDTFPSKL